MIQKKILVAALLAGSAALGLSTVASAAAPGFYVGGQLGYTNTHYGTSDFQNMASASVNTTGFGFRPFVGYQFNQNWAVEGGYTRYANAHFKNIVLNSGATLADGDVKQSAWDIVGKGMLPFDNGFGVFGKAGIAYVRRNNTDGLNTYSDLNKWRPVVGLGGSYDFNPNVSVDISWTRVVSGSGIEAADLAAAGVAYHFG